MSNQQIVEGFYEAFKNGDADAMVAYYDDDIVFEDPVFGVLNGVDAKNMWRMLVERSRGDLEINFSNITSQGDQATAHWEAIYFFSKTRRRVHNKIDASFLIKNGKILKHNDYFSFYAWSSQALGIPGYVLGWTSFLRNKVRRQSLALLQRYSKKIGAG